MRSVLLLVAVAACSSAGAPHQLASGKWPNWHEPRAGTPPPGDAAGLRAMFGAQAQVLDGGVWFADPTCRMRFGKPRVVQSAELEGFAKCLGELGLHATDRRSGHDDTSVLADSAGFELEAHVVDHKLDFIGFAGRGASAPELPTITPQTLESLRTNARDDGPPHPLGAYMRVCVSAEGTTTVGLADEATPELAAELTTVAKAWTFKPFTVGDQVVPACAIVPIPAPPANTTTLVPIPPGLAKSGAVQFAITRKQLEDLREGGNPNIRPDDRDVVDLHETRLAGEYKLCLDEHGNVESATTAQSTGVPTYDAKVTRTMLESWKFHAYKFAGIGTAVCSRVRIVYVER